MVVAQLMVRKIVRSGPVCILLPTHIKLTERLVVLAAGLFQ